MMTAMRAGVLVAVALVGCAHGSNNNDVDAAPDTAAVDPCGGLPCQAIYVAPSGADAAAGTKDAPARTIGAGIAKAAEGSIGAVFVQAGSYAEALAMRSGVTVYGGFDARWNRGDAATTEITAPSPAVKFDALAAATGLDHVTVKTADAAQPGASSIAVLVTGSAMVQLTSVKLLSGAGANGTDGSDGGNGGTGLPGQVGGKGVEHSDTFGCDNDTLPVGGLGGGSSCGRTGGVGGAPGVGNGSGVNGGVGAGGTSGGAGGASTKPGAAGAVGANGAAGMLGASGAEAGMFVAGVYIPANGGNGGGGGGTNLCDSSGSSGGGGGGGGCGGGAGTAGTGGGGSFGVVAIDSHVVVKASTVTAGNGGAGGRGGSGGAGGAGAAGGNGGLYGGSSSQDDGGNGAAGGGGGNGGHGGGGGGGGGGPSAALVCAGSGTITIPQSTLTSGT